MENVRDAPVTRATPGRDLVERGMRAYIAQLRTVVSEGFQGADITHGLFQDLEDPYADLRVIGGRMREIDGFGLLLKIADIRPFRGMALDMLRRHTQRPNDPRRIEALKALAAFGDSSAQDVLREEQRAEEARRRQKSPSQGSVGLGERGCCPGNIH